MIDPDGMGDDDYENLTLLQIVLPIKSYFENCVETEKLFNRR